jgi:hypothetical protein
MMREEEEEEEEEGNEKEKKKKRRERSAFRLTAKNLIAGVRCSKKCIEL